MLQRETLDESRCDRLPRYLVTAFGERPHVRPEKPAKKSTGTQIYFRTIKENEVRLRVPRVSSGEPTVGGGRVA